ncbi:MAG: hypothetical protein R3F59_24945 [Myxococcota bacterium]
MSVNAGRWPMRAVRCRQRDATLGVAAVVYSRKQGTMAWGHASLRVVRCVDGVLDDAEYETYRLSAWNEALFREEHAGEAFLEGDYLHDQRGALVLFRTPTRSTPAGTVTPRPTTARSTSCGSTGRRPRSTPSRGAEAWYDEQLAALRAHEPLTVKYRARSTNCTTPLQRLLGVEDPPTMPFGWLRRLEGEVRLRVLRPSHAMVRRWGGLPATATRPHPLVRGSGALPEPLSGQLGDALVGVRSLGPWDVTAP